MPDADRGRDGAVPDGTYRAEFDRYETTNGGEANDLAVLVVVDDGEPRGSLTLPTVRVPALDGSPAGTAHYRLTVTDGAVTELTHLPEESAREHDRVAARLERAHE